MVLFFMIRDLHMLPSNIVRGAKKKLPESKRDMWFNLLEDQGYLNPLEEEIPNRFKQYGWWKEHHS